MLHSRTINRRTQVRSPVIDDLFLERVPTLPKRAYTPWGPPDRPVVDILPSPSSASIECHCLGLTLKAGLATLNSTSYTHVLPIRLGHSTRTGECRGHRSEWEKPNEWPNEPCFTSGGGCKISHKLGPYVLNI